jgi:hypothetical protein
MSIRFTFISSYMGEVAYRVESPEGTFRIRHVVEASDYHRSIYNGTSEQFDRAVVSSVGCVIRNGLEIVPQRVIDAFNDYRESEHRKTLEWIETQPSLRKSLGDRIEELIPSPVRLPRARWDLEAGRWIQH